LGKISFLRRRRISHFIAKYYKNTQSEESERVALFVDTYANFFDNKLADLAVAVLESLGLQVYIPPNQRPSGLIPFSLGDRDRAEKLAARNIELFADLIRQGYTVISLEPSTASCLSQDYPSISDSDDTKLLADNVWDFCSFVLQRKRNGLIQDEFQPVSKRVAYHAPCRGAVHYAIGEGTTAAEELLRLIPELQVQRIEQGCCGAAGVFGFRKKNYRLSLKIGMNLFKELRAADIDFAVSDCNACRLQMEHGAKTQTLHPIHLLAESLCLCDK
jgi:Fe-S oxidoreductase